MAKVFLGGTCNESIWRNLLIPRLTCTYFNPVVEDWTPACIEKEYEEKSMAEYELYVFTPEMTGCFAAVELIDAANNHPNETLFAIIGDWSDKASQMRSIEAVAELAEKRGATRFYSLIEIADFLNNN